MKQILLICAVVALVGCGSVYELPSGGGEPSLKPKVVKIVKVEQPDADRINLNLGDIIGQKYEAKPNSDPIVEKAIRRSLKKPEGELTKADLEKVTGLALGDTNITDAGLKEVAKLQNLGALDLCNTQITDAGLKEVAKLQNLTELWLVSTEITNAGLKDLAKLQNLEGLGLSDTLITEAGIAELKKALPNCAIIGP